MKKNHIYISLAIISGILLSFTSCEDLTDVNKNPTEVTEVGGHLLLSSVLSNTARVYHADNFSDIKITTVVQYLQVLNKSGECRYQWGDVDWTKYYDILRNNQQMINDAETRGNNFYLGVGLVMKSFIFGYMTDLWGDCPYSEALKGDKGIYQPKFDAQEEIFNGIFAELERANEELSKPMPHYSTSEGTYDLSYAGDITKWRKMANSLALRYYMRLSQKQADKAKAGIEKIMGDPAKYPVFESIADNNAITYPGMNQWDSWPGGLLNWADGNDFRRRRPCVTVLNTLRELNDPRRSVWFEPVQVQIVVEEPPYTYNNADTVVVALKKRYIHDNASILAGGTAYYDTSKYVGLRINLMEPERFTFNLTDMGDDGKNPSISYLASRYQLNTEKLVKASLINYAEVCFILAEAAQKGWNVGATAETYYNKGVEASLGQYEVATGYGNYIAQDRAKYDGTLARIIEQKWLSQFLQPESWFDYRRLRLPDFPIDPYRALHPQIPLRFKYPVLESRNNSANYNAAVQRLEETTYSDAGNDDSYSKPWILQGTGMPW